jgi:hypothetical protein
LVKKVPLNDWRHPFFKTDPSHPKMNQIYNIGGDHGHCYDPINHPTLLLVALGSLNLQ